jgi:CDP-L-myo-inositol myo-inositolphosphotransferase
MILQPVRPKTNPTTSTTPVVVLLPGRDARVLGGSVRARNQRVAARVGAEVVDASALARHGRAPALIIPPNVLIDADLFAAPLSEVTGATWLERSSGHAILASPADEANAHCTGRDAIRGTRRRVTVGSDAFYDISTRTARRHAVWSILKRTAKPTDGWVSRNCNRPISRLISFVLLSLGLKASHASALTLLVGLSTAVLAVRPGYMALVATGVLFQLASVLDGVDGEMARATLTESDAGARLDAIVDQLTYIACFAGVTIGWAREGGAAQAVFWTLAIALALVVSLVRGGRFVSRHAPDASFVFIDRAVRRAARDSNQVALRLAAGGFAFLRRDLFAVIFLAVAVLGRRALIPGLVGAGVVLANLTLSVYRRELAAAAVAEHPIGR